MNFKLCKDYPFLMFFKCTKSQTKETDITDVTLMFGTFPVETHYHLKAFSLYF